MPMTNAQTDAAADSMWGLTAHEFCAQVKVTPGTIKDWLDACAAPVRPIVRREPGMHADSRRPAPATVPNWTLLP